MAKKSPSELLDGEVLIPGRTATRSVQITAVDGSIFPATVYVSVNMTDDPHLRKQLLEGRLNEIACPVEEGRVYRPAICVAAHDEQKEFFALMIPEALRHREFQCRGDLLDMLANSPEPLAPYFRSFAIAFGPAELARLHEEHLRVGQAGPEEKTTISEIPQAPPVADDRAELLARIEELEAALAEQPEDRDLTDDLQARRAEIEARAAELEAQAEKLKIDKEQLEEVASRVERESARIDEASTRIQQERSQLESGREELEEERRQLQVKELNLEQEKLRLQQMTPASEQVVDESTQVVTDDQFIEIVEDGDEESSAPAPERKSAPEPEPSAASLEPFESASIPTSFYEAVPEGKPSFARLIDDLIVVGYRVGDARARLFAKSELAFLFQLHHSDETPIIAMTLAAFDDEGECVDAAAAVLGDFASDERALLDRFARDLRVHLAIYDDGGTLVSTWKATAPIRRNIGWARQRLRHWREDHGAEGPEAIDAAIEAVLSDDFELVGSMRHPFATRDFTDFEGASDVRLSVGILGYWSRPEQVDYLVGNRGYPMDAFVEIQKRVVRQALNWGIALDDRLREVAIGEAIIPDQVSLTQRLLANFAEVCVGLRPNDLDPLDQWDNWDELIQLAEKHGITPNPDVVELAEVSLKRAQEYEEMLEAEDDDDIDAVGAPRLQPGPPQPGADVEGLVVSRRSEATGVTYFLPDEAVMDTFDDLSSMERDDLVLLLKDDNGRLEASQVLLERFGADVLLEVMEAAEEMNAAQMTALIRFVEVRADGLEAALMQALDDAGPAGTRLAARALAYIGCTAALPRLLDAVRDPNRRGYGRNLAHCLARFGDKLLPPLSRALKSSPDDPDLLSVLAALESVRPGTLEEMASNRNEGLKRAAEEAKKMA